MPKIGRIEAPPEELVCIAARNDYREDGVLDHSFEEIMDGASVNDEIREAYVRIKTREDPSTSFEELDEEDQLEIKKRTLISHLMQHGHWGPFEHPSTTIAIEDVTRTAMAQITRHRNFTFDIMSLRYVTVDTGELLEEVDMEEKPLEDLFEYPEEFEADEVASRHGVEEIEVEAETRLRAVNDAYVQSAETYNELVDAGVPQEEARKVLPMATKINMVVSGNARSWMHLINVRGKANVQGEAREIVDGCFHELQDWMPYTFSKYDEMLPMKLTP